MGRLFNGLGCQRSKVNSNRVIGWIELTFSDSEEAYVAIKISTSKTETDTPTQEFETMSQLASIDPRPQHVIQMLDNFDLEGPNGMHKCFVLETLGPNVDDMVDFHTRDSRVPGKLAKILAKQALVGLESLHRHKIGHGDLHTRNLAFTIPSMHGLPEERFMELLSKPDIGKVTRSDGKPIDIGVPEYLVGHTLYRREALSFDTIKIIDFGESFTLDKPPRNLNTPLAIRAPEILFNDRLDYRVDLWAMGCMLFELFVGQTPFDSLMGTPPMLAAQMQEMISDSLPVRWQGSWLEMRKEITPSSEPEIKLQEWLEELYFVSDRKAELTKDDIVQLGGIIRKLLRFEPSARASAEEILNDPWFRDMS
ncbi:hypothetical protein N7517_001655 [Penicillium concentricum]|uniref:Protein kinase domain-containing protein n=1 Tax=Penicillium concentricum TaxID=293559 RepID=A0A9W9STX0_9EURO|nr:uncharacterized protein N7517_001655 [Penicillium concentricum]KAJ5383744.1 hypothetical protein N7517_001655 [Penicillium concentricum]